MPLPSSFWIDELVTSFIVRYPADPSLAVAPQVPASIYYWLPRAMHALFGFSEFAYRVPSVLADAADSSAGRMDCRLLLFRARRHQLPCR
jgi:hypothetical protein